MVTQFESANGYALPLLASEAAYNQAVASSQGDLATSAATISAAPVGPIWATQTVTWAFASASDGGSSSAPISGSIQSQYQAVVDQALRAWAAASGLQFQQVADPTSADIQFGWGDFGTASSSVIGYTSGETTGNAIDPGVIVRLEDPSETALIAGANGQPTYSGTDGATLYQVALHEIGHALGLGDNSDPNSVMYFSLGANNQTLDATDIAAIQAAYDNPPTAQSMAALTHAMASFGASSGSLAILPPTSAAVADNQLAAPVQQ